MKRLWWLGLSIVPTVTLIGCIDERNVDVAMADASVSVPVEAGLGSDTRVCTEIDSTQRLPARAAAIEGAPISHKKTVYVDDLFNQFVAHCGACHVDVGLGGFKTDRTSFSDVVNQGWIDSMYLNDPNTVMPTPSVGGKIYNERAPDDPVNALAELLQMWLDQGRPRDVFTIPVTNSAAEGPFRFKPEVASKLTNIGSCLPEKALYASDQKAMAEMDAKFVTMTRVSTGTPVERIGLPERLSDTDLTTFDSRELAKTGVLSYAPAYPQWVDPDSRSWRHVRTPLGETIQFDSTTQQFTIPAGTRFYRTLLQRVTEASGAEKWRKVETQLIVAWPNVTTKSGKSAVTSLFGTYAWNDDETQATLVTDPYRNGEPFRDRVVTYVSDEVKAAKALSEEPPNVSRALRDAHAIRSFAIMGSRRCGGCHRGSQTRNFALGFTPLQIARRAKGEGGITEEVGPDELSQLSRFIDYGLITGLSSQEEVVPLEESQGTRTPRNEYELQAQAYLLGNCAHCHSPVGDATLEIAELQNGSLDFMPSATGGIFRFPLESVSTRIMRAAGGPSPTVEMPYITPSIMDLGPRNNWKPDYFNTKCTLQSVDFGRSLSTATPFPMMAPWRSLIYRTVATPFSYSDDLALMLHMPPHTQNFDCNAPRILGDWMVSITSEPKPEVASEYGVETVGETALTTDRCWALDSTVQPYREVTKGHSGYKTAVAGTTDRLYKFHNSPVVPSDIVPTIEDRYPEIPSYYSFCPDRFDIFDPYVLSDPSKYSVPGDNNVYRDGKKVMPPDGVPNNAHWVVFDPTTVPGDWAPRRPDWYDVLVRDGKPAALASNANSGERAKWDFQALAVTVLSGDRTGGAGDGVHLTGALTTFAMTEFPMGLWKAKAGCNFSRVSTVAQYQAAKQVPTWMQSALDSKTLTGAEPVYAVPPGEMIHNLICSNCHGEQGDSSGRHATVLSEMTGGRATVTDLRNGMLNNDNLQRIFSAGPNDHSTSAEDWAARYFNWMALGGTNQNIPRSILAMVASTAVIGQVRPLDTPPVDANMLSSARNRCATLVPMKLEYLDSSQSMNQFSLMSRDQYGRYSFEGGMFEKANAVPQTSLVYGNGDAALWVRVCSIDNLPPVRAFSLVPGKEEPVFNIVSDLYPPESYPATAGVVNHLGQVVKAKDSGGIPSDNYFPWCIRMPANDSELQQADDWITQHTSNDGTKLPYCPELDNYQKPYIGRRSLGIVNDAHLNRDAVLLWTMRGAVNAGMLTYAYLRQLSNEDIVPTPTYDHCERISY